MFTASVILCSSFTVGYLYPYQSATTLNAISTSCGSESLMACRVELSMLNISRLRSFKTALLWDPLRIQRFYLSSAELASSNTTQVLKLCMESHPCVNLYEAWSPRLFTWLVQWLVAMQMQHAILQGGYLFRFAQRKPRLARKTLGT